MPKKVGQENSCTAVGTGQGGLCLVEDSWHGHHVEGQQSMVRLFITVEPCVNMAVCSLNGRMLVMSTSVRYWVTSLF